LDLAESFISIFNTNVRDNSVATQGQPIVNYGTIQQLPMNNLGTTQGQPTNNPRQISNNQWSPPQHPWTIAGHLRDNPEPPIVFARTLFSQDHKCEHFTHSFLDKKKTLEI
jgi:hypothetical protein